MIHFRWFKAYGVLISNKRANMLPKSVIETSVFDTVNMSFPRSVMNV